MRGLESLARTPLVGLRAAGIRARPRASCESRTGPPACVTSRSTRRSTGRFAGLRRRRPAAGAPGHHQPPQQLAVAGQVIQYGLQGRPVQAAEIDDAVPGQHHGRPRRAPRPGDGHGAALRRDELRRDVLPLGPARGRLLGAAARRAGHPARLDGLRPRPGARPDLLRAAGRGLDALVVSAGSTSSTTATSSTR